VSKSDRERLHEAVDELFDHVDASDAHLQRVNDVFVAAKKWRDTPHVCNQRCAGDCDGCSEAISAENDLRAAIDAATADEAS
jgi:hypothetical protein